jgi:replicative DNA helicase
LMDRRVRIDLVTLKEDLDRRGELEEVGGVGYVSALIDGVPRSTNVAYYAKILKEKATLRALIFSANKVLSDAYAAEQDASDILETAERTFFKIREHDTRTVVISDEERGRSTRPAIEKIIESEGGMLGMPTGLRDLDADTRGLQKGDLIIIAARPSMGKTSLLQHLAIHAGRKDPVLLFSLEMSEAQLNLREVFTRASVNGWRVMHGRSTPWEQQRLAWAIEELRQGNVHVVDNTSITLGQIRAIARRFKSQHGLSLVGLDYIQMMQPEATRGRERENRTLELGVLSRGFKAIARELNVPMVVLSQLSRGPESRPDKRPQLSDLRESGALEQDADVVMLCFRPNAYPDIRQKNTYQDHYYEINLAKQRNGPTGILKVAFYRETTRFADWTEEPEGAPVKPEQAEALPL